MNYSRITGRGRYNELAQEWEKKRQTYYLITGSDPAAYGTESKSLRRILIEVAKEGWFLYSNKIEYMVIDSLVKWEKKFSNLDFTADDIVVTAGGMGAFSIIQRLMIKPGDEILNIIPSHFLSTLGSISRYLGAKLVTSPSIEEEGWEPDLDKLRENISDKTKFIEIDYPNNPTGAIYSEKSRKGIIDLAGEYDIPIVSDEIYQHFTYDGIEAPSMATLTDDVPIICVRSISKLFRACGWRFGWIGFHDPQGKIEELRRECKNPVNRHLIGGSMSTPIHIAAKRVLDACEDLPRSRAPQSVDFPQEYKDPMSEFRDWRIELKVNRDYMVKRISEMEGINMVKPVSTFYGYPHVEGIGKIWKDDMDFFLGLMKEEGVGFAPGGSYGAPAHFRTQTVPRLSELEDIYDRLERYIQRHSK